MILILLAVIALCWYAYTQGWISTVMSASDKPACGCAGASGAPGVPAAPGALLNNAIVTNAPSRKSTPSDSAVSGFDNDRGETYGSAAYLNQSPWEISKSSPSEYELERHRIDVKNPEKRVMDEIYAMNDDERFEEVLKGMSHSLNPDPLIIKSDETRDDMLFRSLTDGNKDGALDDGMYAPIDDFERQALIRQSNAGNPLVKGYI